MSESWTVPGVTDSWALFLDVDGTLLDIAPTPRLVRVEPMLPELLNRLARRFGGCLALVSGRSIATLDLLFNPFRFPAAGIHGVERRDAGGRLHIRGLSPEQLDNARRELARFVAAHPGLLLEDKERALAVHYRLAPELESEVHAVVEAMVCRLDGQAHAQKGHCVVEIKSRAASKYSAIAAFMREPPFAGRVPVFLGDDVTDRDGFEYVEQTGGHSIFVGATRHIGRGWLPDPSAVRAWLHSLDQEQAA
jgi:trehalose 6-phosphate phosphatase